LFCVMFLNGPLHRGELALFDYLLVIGPRELSLVATPKRGR
jgi:hypothetical protein